MYIARRASSSAGAAFPLPVKYGIICSTFLLANAALAQTSDSAKKNNDELLEEVVVTGTLIRGIPPGGTNLIGVSQKDVQEAGVSTTAQLLQTIPQLGSFSQLQTPSGGFNTQTSNRPNLRNLPGFTTAGGSPTLVLMDGHRLVGMGISTTTPDPDIIPPGVIERVEIVPDGGSAVYGSDAVAGVINFITRKNIEGIKFDGHQGWADNYKSSDGNITAGHGWGSGSAYLSYNYSQHDALFARDRDFVRQPATTVSGVPFPVTSLKCSPSNVQNLASLPSGRVYAMPYTTGSAVADTANQCDETDAATIYPKEHRHSVFLGISQELGDANKLDVRSYYMDRRMNSVLTRYTGTSFIGPASLGLTPSPFQAAHFINPASPAELHQVSWAFGPADAGKQNLSLTSWGITPTLTTELGHGWELRSLVNYGESRTEQHTSETNSTALALATAAGLFNPYDPESSNPQALNAIGNTESFGLNRQHLFNVRTVADGALFALPGGEVKVATGLEYSSEQLKSLKADPIVPGTEFTGYAGLFVGTSLVVPPQPPSPMARLTRNTKSAFAELSIPVFGKSNGMPGLEELTFSASGRYDHYSDFGDTFNPKFGVTYKALDWIKVRGNWGKSFVAPSLADYPAADVTKAFWANLGFLLPPASLTGSGGRYPAPVGSNTNTLVILGNAPGINPETAKTWSVGIDVDPPVVPGLHTSLTYWNINFQDLIQLPPFTNQLDYWSNYGSTITVHPSQAQLNAVLGSATATVGAPCGPLPDCVYSIVDARKSNFGILKLDGLDFTANYTLDTGFGSMDFGINANYELSRKAAPVPGAAFADVNDPNNTKLRAQASVAAQIHQLRAQIILNHREGSTLKLPVGATNSGAPQQTHVASYDVVNLFFKYDVNGAGLLKDLSFTLNVDNVLDRDPPHYEQQSITLYNMGFTNGNTLGRFVQLGVSKQF
jgi:iron complex outermembrane recepter protein